MEHRWQRLVLACALFLTIWGAKLAVVDRFGTDLPFWDQWGKEGAHLFQPWFEQGELWSNLIRPHNEHRIAPTLLLNFGLMAASGQWDGRVQCTFSAAVHALVLTGLFLWMLRRLPRGWNLVGGALIVGLGATAIASENVISGFQSQFYFLAGFSLLAIDGIVLRPVFSRRWWLGVAAAVCALFSMGSGLLCAPVIAGIALWRWWCGDSSRGDAGGALVVAVTIGGLGAALRAAAPWHEPLHAHSAQAFLLYVVRCLAWPLPGQAWLATILWLPWVVLAIRALRRGLRRRLRQPPGSSTESPDDENPGTVFVLAAGGWVLAQVVAVAYSRSAGGEMPASRYGDIFALGMALNFSALALLASRVRGARFIGGAWLVVAGMCLWVETQTVWSGALPGKKDDNLAYEQNVSRFVLTNDYETFSREKLPFPVTDWLARLLRTPALRAILPASVREPVRVEGLDAVGAPQLPSLAPRRTRAQFEAGVWRSAPLPAGRGWWKFETAGHLSAGGATLQLVSVRDGRVLGAIAPTKFAGTSWRAAYVRAPSEPAILVSRVPAPAQWIAFSEPVEISALSYRVWQLGQVGGWLMLAGLCGGGTAVWLFLGRRPLPGNVLTRASGAVLASGAIALLFTPGIRPGAAPFALEIELAGDVYTAVGIYFDRGTGFSEPESSHTFLDSYAGMSRLRLPMPAGTYSRLRFDPVERPSAQVLGSARVVSFRGETIRPIAFEEFEPFQQFRHVGPSPGGLEIITTPDANDPQFIITFNPPLRLALTWTDLLADAAPRFALSLLALALLWLGYAHRAWLERTVLPANPNSVTGWRGAALLGALLLVVWGAKLSVIDRFGTDLPYWDQWTRESRALFVPFFERGEFWANVFAAHNEHRIAPTLATNLALVAAGGQWDARLQCLVNAALHALIAAGLLGWAIHRLARGWVLASGALLALIFALPIATENVIAGFQSQFYFLIGFSLLAINGLLAAPFTRGWWLGLAAGFAACVSMGSGVLCVAPVLAIALLRLGQQRSLRGLTPFAVAAAAVVAFGVSLRPDAPWHQELHARSAGQFLTFFARCLAWPMRTMPWLAPLLWLPWLGLLARRLRAPRDAAPDRAEDFVLAGGAWVILQAAAAAYARGGGDPLPATRYGDLFSLGPIFSCWALALIARTTALRAWPLAWGAGAAALVGVAGFDAWHGDLPQRRTEYAAMERNLAAYLSTGAKAEIEKEPRAFPMPDDLAGVLQNPTVHAHLPTTLARPIALPGVDATAAAPARPLAFRRVKLVQEKEWRSAELPRANGGWWKIETTGHLGARGVTLDLVSVESGRVLGTIAPSKPAGDNWRAAYVPAPRERSVLVARTPGPEQWFAFTDPVPMTSLSYHGWRLVKIGEWIGGLGLAGALLVVFGGRRWREP